MAGHLAQTVLCAYACMHSEGVSCCPEPAIPCCLTCLTVHRPCCMVSALFSTKIMHICALLQRLHISEIPHESNRYYSRHVLKSCCHLLSSRDHFSECINMANGLLVLAREADMQSRFPTPWASRTHIITPPTPGHPATTQDLILSSH